MPRHRRRPDGPTRPAADSALESLEKLLRWIKVLVSLAVVAAGGSHGPTRAVGNFTTGIREAIPAAVAKFASGGCR